jgi:hypothetical protein
MRGLEVDIMYKQKKNTEDLEILNKELDDKYEKLKEKYEEKIAVFNSEKDKDMGYLNEKLINANEMISIFQSERDTQLKMTTKHSDELLDLEYKKQMGIQVNKNVYLYTWICIFRHMCMSIYEHIYDRYMSI